MLSSAPQIESFLLESRNWVSSRKILGRCINLFNDSVAMNDLVHIHSFDSCAQKSDFKSLFFAKFFWIKLVSKITLIMRGFELRFGIKCNFFSI